MTVKMRRVRSRDDARMGSVNSDMRADFALPPGVLVAGLAMELAAADAGAPRSSEDLDDVVSRQQARRGERYDAAELPAPPGLERKNSRPAAAAACGRACDPRALAPRSGRGDDPYDDERPVRPAVEQRNGPCLTGIAFLTHPQSHALARIVGVDLPESRDGKEVRAERQACESNKCDRRRARAALEC
jgi:hypothetical protein